MDYKEKQRLARESTKPKLVEPATEHERQVVAQMTVAFSRVKRRRKPSPNPKHTKKRHKGHKR